MNPRTTLVLHEQAERPCADCPASYAREMRGLGRCNGEPGLVA